MISSVSNYRFHLCPDSRDELLWIGSKALAVAIVAAEGSLPLATALPYIAVSYLVSRVVITSLQIALKKSPSQSSSSYLKLYATLSRYSLSYIALASLTAAQPDIMRSIILKDLVISLIFKILFNISN